MKVIIHYGKKEKIWTYDYIPFVGEEITSSKVSFKVLRKTYEPESDTLRLYLKSISVENKIASINSNFEQQRESLIKEIEPYLSEFGKDMCNDFFDYWTEEITKGRLKGQCRYVEQKTWSIYKRLNTWRSNNFNKKQ